MLTGQLGDVMKESAHIALSYIRGHADDWALTQNALIIPTFTARAGRRHSQDGLGRGNDGYGLCRCSPAGRCAPMWA